MITFVISVVLLLLGYFVYAKLIERWLGTNPHRPTPAIKHPDGVDYVPMKPWRIFLIQFLNIAGVGPIIGAIMGAQFGTASFLWIVFGCIFGGAVHDYIAGYMSLQQDGCSLPEGHGHYLGTNIRYFMRFFTIFLLILVGIVFVNTPATLIQQNFTPNWSPIVWIVAILAYYFIATLLPIDKLIGRIYPFFGFLLFAMAVALVIAFFIYKPDLPELWTNISNQHPDAENNPIFPMMFISIACGAISGFHATQSPLMARCMTNEKQARPVFYGAMIAEGIVALIWAATACYFFHDKPELCIGKSGNDMVSVIANEWFTPVIATITILGVICAAITSGDTALRSARLIIADILHIKRHTILNRIVITLSVIIVTAIGIIFSINNTSGFQIIWRYFSWANQVLAAVSLWMITCYLFWRHKPYIITLLPALFMTMVTASFIFVSNTEGLGRLLPDWLGYTIGALITLACLAAFITWASRRYLIITEYYSTHNTKDSVHYR